MENIEQEENKMPVVPMEDRLRFILGMRIHAARRKLGISQIEFGRKMKTSNVTICRWETGKIDPSALQLWKISKLVKQDINWFYEP
jgi:transcriptional regulator with XRE-family HTH domain